jgi:NhaA family Na+:H+ antiporter
VIFFKLLFTPVRSVISTLNGFIKSQIMGGLILVLSALIALLWVNSSYESSYKLISDISLGFHVGDFGFSTSFLYWINDGLMSLFFLLIGLEVKREICIGELNTLKKAFLPVVAAIFGMILPAIIFFVINFKNPENYRGWAIPTATDVAFALGVLALFRKRIPKNIFLLLTTIAIVDDIGAVLIISIFYTKNIDFYNIFLSFICFSLLGCLNFFKIKRLLGYGILGTFLWYFLFKSGVHASISGVLLAMTIPLGREEMLIKKMKLFPEKVKTLIGDLQSPLQRLERALNFPVNYFIVPLFILFNAGISFYDLPSMRTPGEFISLISTPLTLGILLGLLLGKPLGIVLAIFILKKLGWVSLHKDVTIKDIAFMGCLAGIGFTMAIFISDLAFPFNLIAYAKIGILLGSLLSILTGFFLLLILKK